MLGADEDVDECENEGILISISSWGRTELWHFTSDLPQVGTHSDDQQSNVTVKRS